MVRAKFYCSSKTQNVEHDGNITYTVELSPVVYGSKENEDFYKWTPWGVIKLGTINEKAAHQFEVGKEYYVDFSKAGE